MRRVNTFHRIQKVVQDGTEHILDVAHHITGKLVSNTEDTPAYDHRVHVAEVRFSWQKQRQGVRLTVLVNDELSITELQFNFIKWLIFFT